jgi:HPt (histidine-containing phosphotransfer) domain-containing protein
MTVITRRPENRLGKSIWAPGGKTIEQALEDAIANLDEARDAHLEALRVKLTQIQSLGRSIETGAKMADIRALYALSGEVLEIAGVFGMPELSQAAYSLCDLLDNLRTRKVWNWPAVQVHLNGLLLLSDPAHVPPEARKSVVDGLLQVCQRIAGAKPPSPPA